MRSFLVILSALTIANIAVAKSKKSSAPKVPDEATILKTYDMYKIDQMATLLMAAVDAPTPNKSVCSIAGSRALKLGNVVHSLLDQQVDAYIKARIDAHKTMTDGTWDSRCTADCSCGLETSIMEKVGYATLAKIDQHVYDQVSKLSARQSSADIKACLAKTQWICKSDLMKYVNKIAGKGGAY